MTDAIEIKKGVPIPKPGNETVYPFSQMAVGDSFTLPPGHIGNELAKAGRVRRVVASAHNYGRNSNMKFRCRLGEDGCVTVWRVA